MHLELPTYLGKLIIIVKSVIQKEKNVVNRKWLMRNIRIISRIAVVVNVRILNLLVAKDLINLKCLQ